MRNTDSLLAVAAVLVVIGLGMIYLPLAFLSAGAAVFGAWWFVFEDIGGKKK